MAKFVNGIECGDCIAGMKAMKPASVDLVFADPPFNIGYEYDVYEDAVEHEQYIAWSREWIGAVHQVLKSDGAFWLAIGDEYAAELKLASQEIGFHCRSWVIWYYTFGVNCARKFSRSHAHLFHFVKDPQRFTFREDDLDNRIPSARQLVYNDRRANPKGRLPDDTWIIRPADVVGEIIDEAGYWSPEDLKAPSDTTQTWTLRPQDIGECFGPREDTWYFPRVAGTFKERAGFHGCQMPEQLLGRIIRTCSQEGELVLDPFSGSATTLAVAKKLGRRYLGFDLSSEYVEHGKRRLDSICVGDRLDGSAEPLLSAPKTGTSPNQTAKRSSRQAAPKQKSLFDTPDNESRCNEIQLELTLRGVREAFLLTRDGHSVDRVVADPELNEQFAAACRKIGLVGDTRTWNLLLLRLRKSGKLTEAAVERRTPITWQDCDPFLFASEIAMQMLIDQGQAESLNEILCDPELVRQFDQTAQQFSPGFSPLEYRWAAVKLKKHAKTARGRGAVLSPPTRFKKAVAIGDLDVDSIPDTPGVYLVSDGGSQRLYAGETYNLRQRLSCQFAEDRRDVWQQISANLSLQSFATESKSEDPLAWQSCLVSRFKPRLNFHELMSGVE